ncbi:MAG: hypothetical protein M0T70_02815 [Geobacteraceae bacterium]|nr:hypothetical protein [Geobacteraceae bacterium]
MNKLAEYGYIKRVDAMLEENRALKIKSAEILERVRKEQQNRPLRIGKR